MLATDLINKFGGWTESYWFYVYSDNPIELRYDPKDHVYLLVTEDGQLEKQAGVTTVCHIIDKSEVLIRWACRMMAQKLLQTAPYADTGEIEGSVSDVVIFSRAELEKWVLEGKNAHEERLEDAGTIGSIAHDWIEKYIKFILAHDDEGLLAHLANFPKNEQSKNGCLAALDWMVKHNVRWLDTERKIYSREWRYAGTMDGLCIVDSCGISTCTGCRGKVFKDRLSVADWKTSNYLYMEYLFQTAAYENAYEEEFKVDILDRWIIRLGKDDGEFEAWRREPEDFGLDFGGFLDALKLTRRVRDVELNLQARRADIRAAEKQVRDAARAVREALEKEERAKAKAEKQQARLEALAKECTKAKTYKGVRAPSCKTNNDSPCDKCKEIYQLAKKAKDDRQVKPKVKKARPEPKKPDYSELADILQNKLVDVQQEKLVETRPSRLLPAKASASTLIYFVPLLEPIVATIGESVSYHIGSDADGNAIAIYEEDEATVKKFYENWGNEKTTAAISSREKEKAERDVKETKSVAPMVVPAKTAEAQVTVAPDNTQTIAQSPKQAVPTFNFFSSLGRR